MNDVRKGPWIESASESAASNDDDAARGKTDIENWRLMDIDGRK